MAFTQLADHVFALDGGKQLTVTRSANEQSVRIRLTCAIASPLVLHWGLAWRFRHEWQLPPEEFRPPQSTVQDSQALQTPFAGEEIKSLDLELPKPREGRGPLGLKFVLHLPKENVWLKSRGSDLFLPLVEHIPDPRLPTAKLRELAEQIIDAEKGDLSWSLMHRFNLCHDLLDQAEGEAALALLFAWLRYSAIRQLDWQRRYNTKPRELAHAQDRLTIRLAGLWRSADQDGRRRWLRLMLTTLGRGGDGQRVRDEILHIMHRNHLKEVGGTFVEEWHQKLHNNTTPDDVVICQAYLEFLRSNGDKSRFHEKLRAGGVSRERLLSFERPIRGDPDYYADKKDALIREFESFLSILKSVHAGADLDTALNVARPRLDAGLQQQCDSILALRNRNAEGAELAGTICSVRETLRAVLVRPADEPTIRDLLFLDLALEDLFRATVERQELGRLGRDRLADLVLPALRNLQITAEDPELALCTSHWAMLCNRAREGCDWALHAKSVADRAARWVQEFTGTFYRNLQPRAEFLGDACGVEAWTVPLFSEEVIRGGPAFALSLLLRHLDPMLRKQAGLGGWQVISPARAAGRVHGVEHLIEVQNQKVSEPTVLLAKVVGGDEEIPEHVTAVVTLDTPDLVSHVAVRARNAGVLFASCLELETYQRLEELENQLIALEVTPAGDVVIQPAVNIEKPVAPSSNAWNSERPKPLPLDEDGPWVVPQEEFTPAIVGAKSNNLNGLRGKLPDWIHLPRSLALPFGVLERVLAADANRNLSTDVEAQVAALEGNAGEKLARLRGLLQKIAPPPALQQALAEAWQRAGLPSVPEERAWNAIRRVWASQWNERAYLSRRTRGVPDGAFRMAVLIQEVVPANYAFVIHTVNPLTGNRDELFAEVVLGLGETLVGNYPGRALGFVCRKSDLSLHLLSYPSKSVGLYGKGVIFRSDSNGEDLEGFAGAGLYDSYLAEEPEARHLDYSRDRLITDDHFRDDLLRAIARIGLEVEKVLGAPQDIEGAVAGDRFHVVQTRPQVGLPALNPRIRIGNQTANSCTDRLEPFTFAIQNGFDAFEWFADKKISPEGAASGWEEDDFDADARAWIRETGRKHDICFTVHAPWQANPLHAGGVESLLRSLAFARDIGADLLNFHLYMDEGAAGYVRSLEPLLSHAGAARMRLTLENTPHTTPEDFNQTFALLAEKDAVPAGTVGMCLDIGHANLCATTRNDFLRYYDQLAPSLPITHLHVHENYGDVDSHLPIFTGPAGQDDSAIRALMERLRARGYQGAMILEQWPDPPQLLVNAAVRLREML